MTAAEKAIDDDERRALRDTWRASGGSTRRALGSFQTKADKRARRDAHAATLRLAVENLQEASGFERWAEALGLNPHLSAMNAALVALQTPGEVVDTSAGWHRRGYTVHKGERAAGRITAPGFWPLAYFTAAQARVLALVDVDAPLPPAEVAEGLRAALTASLSDGAKPRPVLDALAERIRGEAASWPIRERAVHGSTVDPAELF